MSGPFCTIACPQANVYPRPRARATAATSAPGLAWSMATLPENTRCGNVSSFAMRIGTTTYAARRGVRRAAGRVTEPGGACVAVHLVDPHVRVGRDDGAACNTALPWYAR